MARKNNNAGQPNRNAQITRAARRRDVNKSFSRREHFTSLSFDPTLDLRVLGPGSDNLTMIDRGPVYIAVERELVSA